MIHRRAGALFGLLAVALAGCSRPEAASPSASGEATRAYLRRIGEVRSRINADNHDRIPTLIVAQDQAELTAEGARMEEDARTLSALPVVDIDADAVAFTRNFVAILRGYRAVCLDTAEMFRAVREEAARQADPARRPPPLALDPAATPRDTIGTLDALLDRIARARISEPTQLLFLGPAAETVWRDRDALRSAKEAHHEFTVKVKASFVRRYPGIDWTSKDLLP
jgi:hypothetical protein